MNHAQLGGAAQSRPDPFPASAPHCETLHASFNAMRECQATLRGHPLTAVDRAVGAVIFETATEAASDTAAGCTETPIRAVGIMTGGGKSTSAWAFVAAAYQTDPAFSCAFLVPTVRAAIEAQEGIEALLGAGTVCAWNWATKHNRDDRKARAEFGDRLPAATFDRSEIPSSRIVVLTHEYWKRELVDGRDYGVRRCRGRLRDLVFIDESPDIVSTFSARPGDIQNFHDHLSAQHPDHAWLPVLRNVVARMNAKIGDTSADYATAALIRSSEGEAFAQPDYSTLLNLTDPALSREARNVHVASFGDLCRFLYAASFGAVFYSAHDQHFHAFRLDGDPKGPGLVLLDATADWSDLVLFGRARRVPVPQADYSRLELRHLDQPKRFQRVDQVIRDRHSASAYADWMKDAVLANTEPGDDVLIVAHKPALSWLAPKGDRRKYPTLTWAGRTVDLEHFGGGVGLNCWRRKNVVVIFGEFVKPRWATVATVHAFTGRAPTGRDLQGATSAKGADGYTPKGETYASAQEAHVLRWSKQLAMRGAARNLDGDGRCQPMRLVVSMGYEKLVRNLGRLFPGCPMPRPAVDPAKRTTGERKDEKGTGRDGLVRLLIDRSKPLYGADEVERLTGIPSRNLSSAFRSPRIEAVARSYGWALRKAKELGKAGRLVYLVNADRLITESTASL